MGGNGLKHTVLRQMLKAVFYHFMVKIVQSLLCICFQKTFTGFDSKKIYQFSCFKATREVSTLRNYNTSVSDRHICLYHCSFQEVYLSSAAQK